MIDHILLDVIGAIREALEAALLEQQAVEERFQVDVFLGDVSFETSYSLPGEQNPPRVRADISLEWPTWSQSAYRSWSIGESPAERPELVVEVALRLQRLAERPGPCRRPRRARDQPPRDRRRGARAHGPHDRAGLRGPSGALAAAIEIAYQGAYHLDEAVLEDPEKIDAQVDRARPMDRVGPRAPRRSRPALPAPPRRTSPAPERPLDLGPGRAGARSSPAASSASERLRARAEMADDLRGSEGPEPGCGHPSGGPG